MGHSNDNPVERLDELCEQIIVGFCLERYGQELTPIPTEALLQLLEEHADDVDKRPTCPTASTGSRSIIGTASQP